MRDYLIWNEFGNIYQKTASYDEAIEAYSKAIELAPNFGWPYQNLASAYLSKGLFSEAIPLLQKSIDLLRSNSEKAISFSKLGDAYRQMGDYQNALAAFQQADAFSADPFDRPAKTEPDETFPAVALDPTITKEAAESERVVESVELEAVTSSESDPPVAIEEDLTPELVAESDEPEPVAESVEAEIEAAPESEKQVAAEGATTAPEPDAESVAPEVDAFPMIDTPTPEEEGALEPVAENVKPEEDIALEEDLAPEMVAESVEPEVNAALKSDPILAQDEDLAKELVAGSVVPEVGTTIEEEVATEPVAEISEAGISDHFGELSNDDNFDDSLAEKLDILAEVDTEDTEQSKGLSWVQSLDSESNEEDFVPESEPKPVEVIPPFALGSPIANANKGYQQTDDFESATLLPANFDAPKGSRNSSDNTVQSLDLDMEKSELPEWLKEHIASSDSEDFSEFTIWQPLAQQKETDTGAPERGFNFVELANVPFTGAETSDQPDEQIPTADLFSDFNPEPSLVSGKSEILENSMSDGTALVEQTDLEDGVNAAHVATDIENPLPEAEEVTEPVVTTNVLHSADSYELSQKSEEDLKQSVSIYKKITDINPTNDRAWHTLGELYKSLNEYEEARTSYEQAISINPNREIYHYHLGLVFATQQKNAEASRAFQKVIILNPEHILAHCALAGSYRRLGLDDEAMEHLSIVEPKIQTETEYNRACFQAISENADEALRLLKLALEKRQTSRDWVQRDPDLDNIRNDPRFLETIMSQDTLDNP